MSSYLASSALGRLAAAQRALDDHVAVLPSGACRRCGTADCAPREAAQAVFARYGRLPVRRPGASRPEMIGARRVV